MSLRDSVLLPVSSFRDLYFLFWRWPSLRKKFEEERGGEAQGGETEIARQTQDMKKAHI